MKLLLAAAALALVASASPAAAGKFSRQTCSSYTYITTKMECHYPRVSCRSSTFAGTTRPPAR